MKQTLLILLVIAGFASCNQVREDKTDIQKDTLETVKSDTAYILNDLLAIKDMAALCKKYGDTNVIIDTIWGAEGMFTMGTKLFPGTKNEVEIMWLDTLNNSDMANAGITASFDEVTYEPVFESEWKTLEGVYVGMSLEDLVALNGKPIKFYGFGWDYSGIVVSFEKGKLDGKSIGITLINTVNPEGIDQLSKILGDMEISTENNDLSGYKIKVVSVNVHQE